jgi:hypothetical protein
MLAIRIHARMDETEVAEEFFARMNLLQVGPSAAFLLLFASNWS